MARPGGGIRFTPVRPFSIHLTVVTEPLPLPQDIKDRVRYAKAIFQTMPGRDQEAIAERKEKLKNGILLIQRARWYRLSRSETRLVDELAYAVYGGCLEYHIDEGL